jgi:glycosyl transferase, family 25
MVKIFVVNLKSSGDRRLIMEKQLDKLGLPFEIFDAVNGYEITEAEILESYDADFYYNRPGYYTAGSIGCSLSHFYIYKKIIDDKIDTALVLEDDMIINPDLPEVLEKLRQEIADNEVILLFYLSYLPINLLAKNAVPLAKKYKLYNLETSEGLKATGAYMINYEGAKSMYSRLAPIKTLPDDWHKFRQAGILQSVRAVYPVIVDSDFFATTVRPHEKGGSILRKFLTFSERNKVFPVYQLLRWRRKKSYDKLRNCYIIDNS